MKTCKDCIYRVMCYKHEHYGYENNETCEMFKNKANFVEVCRCEDCEFRWTEDCPRVYYSEFVDDYVDPTEDDDFCSYGERSDT